MPPLDTDAVLREEAKAIHGVDLKSQTGAELYRSLNKLDASALCLSGGGIRSASFGLGVIQALAAHSSPAKGNEAPKAENSLLTKFHYLSTVSGGGYIGSWLSAWINRATWPAVWRGLLGARGPDGTEPHELAWLRVYSNYLTPRLGITSADAWADIALYLRNLLLNWIVLLPAFFGLLLLLKELAIITGWVGKYSPQSAGPLPFLLLAAFAGLLVALVFNTRNRPSRGINRATQTTFVKRNLLPAIASGYVFALALALQYSYSYIRNSAYFDSVGTFVAIVALLGALCYVGAWIGAVIIGGSAATPKGVKNFFGDLVAWAVSGAVFGAVVGVGLQLFIRNFDEGAGEFFKTGEIVLLVFGVPWMLGAQLCGDVVFAGLTSYGDKSDADHEWLGRAAGWYLLIILVWLLATILVFGNWDWVRGLLEEYVTKNYKEWLAGIGGVSGIVTWIVGKSGLTPAVGEAKNKKQISAQLILAIAAPIFAATLVLSASVLLDYLLFGQPLVKTPFWTAPVVQGGMAPWPEEGTKVLKWLLGMIAIGALASWFVNINRFSLHALYRNRLIRAFLGASNTKRVANLFTGLDDTDNVLVKDLWAKDLKGPLPAASWRPYHVVNMALNIVSSKRLDWQERKAEPFFVSPHYTGSSCKAFRDSSAYGHPERGISLGTAMAISGAAASPNMGYQSSQAAALAMSLFNVRLGWWLGNPGDEGEKTYQREGPAIAFLPFLYEMFAQTTDDRAYIYLSDGGHFENLALYEMVRRRCRYIVVSDAGCDADYAFDDLGNAVRKIGIDLGITIEFRTLDTLHSRGDIEEDKDYDPIEHRFHAVGRINYPAADQGGEFGYLLYVKPGYQDSKISNAGIRNYATAHPDFPHESTADQWFSESQLESYRALGFEIMDGLLTAARSANPPWDGSLKGLFETAAKL